MFRRPDQAVAFGAVLAAVLGLAAGCDQAADNRSGPAPPTSLSTRFYAPRGWAWGRLVLADRTELRYGVASPPLVPCASILVLPDRDEPAEIWFETANDLLARGYTVWVVDAASGGSEALDPSTGVLAQTINQLIRPRTLPLVLVGEGLGATLALRALGEGHAPGVSAAVIASPTLGLATADIKLSPEQLEAAAAWAQRLRVGWAPLPGDGQPRLGRPPRSGLDPARAELAEVWRKNDPALKPRRASLGWVLGYDRAIRAALAPASDPGPDIPVVMFSLAGDTLSASACTRLKACTLWRVPTTAPHLAHNDIRTLWLDQIATLARKPSSACPGAGPPG